MLRFTASALLCLPATSLAQTVQVPLAYNFNGIVHAAEDNNPDDPAGFRSISDRALDFTAGVPADPLLDQYSLVSAAGALDIVHLGDRNTVSGGAWAFDAVADGDDIGTLPTWLPSSDQSGPQTTTLGGPLTLGSNASASFIYQISNGGGSFDVTVDFQGGGSVTSTLFSGDWFGGAYAGRGATDIGAVDANLSVSEGAVDLGAFDGDSITSISFSNSSNTGAGIAILACNVEVSSGLVTTTQVPLNYNFNGIVHQGEDGLVDDPNGFRSISDRGLDFTAGVPANPALDVYMIVDQPGALDIVHLGDRNTVDNANWAFDSMADGDIVGTQPTWLPNSDQTGGQTTTIASPIPLSIESEAKFLLQISNGGGTCDVRFDLGSGGSFTGQLAAGDWFGGPLPGRENVDAATPGANLSITENTIALGTLAGDTLTAITFSNRSNLNAGYAIIACNVTGAGIGTSYCIATVNSTGSASSIAASGSGSVSANDLVLTANSLPSGQPGIFIASPTPTQIPFFNGFLCVSPTGLQRFTTVNAPSGGIVTQGVDINSAAAGGLNVAAGQSYYYQRWNRDPAAGGGNANFSDGVEVAYTP